ncbi:hypothetical protein BDA99DRAFT_536318 [Phascolomyces articulosus]|uniref:Uncharacterized protein n=1 Tax=Phascolomyces articulosus TaxID=60185 RepID=A0AAD5PFM6_9FUNG|nr:hypothetical protein BDA99DRAFT_536318 [Phascolomyces articulosus]
MIGLKLSFSFLFTNVVFQLRTYWRLLRDCASDEAIKLVYGIKCIRKIIVYGVKTVTDSVWDGFKNVLLDINDDGVITYMYSQPSVSAALLYSICNRFPGLSEILNKTAIHKLKKMDDNDDTNVILSHPPL